jgi:hypothetical protein
VAAARTAYLTAHGLQSAAKEAFDDEQEDVQGLRPQADALVLEAWDQMEFKYRRETGPSRRRKCREWGVVYIPRPGEEPDDEEPGGPTPPGVPQNVAVTQENPGDAVVANADLVAGATIYRVYLRAAGSSDPFTLVASAAILPTAITGISPSDWEFTITAGNDAGEGAPSAPVTLTVG